MKKAIVFWILCAIAGWIAGGYASASPTCSTECHNGRCTTQCWGK